MQGDIMQEMQEAIRVEMHGAIREQIQQHILEKKEMQEQIILMQNLVNQLMITQGYDPMFSTTTNDRKLNNPHMSDKCKLFRMDRGDVVAEGVWLSDNPNIVVQGKKLRFGASEIEVKFVNDPKAKLWRPSNGMKTFEDALCYSIALPTDHVIKEGNLATNDIKI